MNHGARPISDGPCFHSRLLNLSSPRDCIWQNVMERGIWTHSDHKECNYSLLQWLWDILLVITVRPGCGQHTPPSFHIQSRDSDCLGWEEISFSSPPPFNPTGRSQRSRQTDPSHSGQGHTDLTAEWGAGVWVITPNTPHQRRSLCTERAVHTVHPSHSNRFQS